MKVKEVLDVLEAWAPLAYAEDFDNVGLLVGDRDMDVTGVLVTLDTLEVIVDEAIAKKSNLIISFHPIIFNGLKKITGATYVERVVLKAIQHNIAIYSMHTALDNSFEGVNAKICQVLSINHPKVLIPQHGTLKKLTTYVPHSHVEEVKSALFNAGAGTLGNYSNCSFVTDGMGSYKAEPGANPSIGKIGEVHREAEYQINITFAKADEHNILNALFQSHPYEEVAFEVTTLDNCHPHIGMGMVGELENAMDTADFLSFTKHTMHAQGIRHSKILQSKIKRVAVLGGSGAFAIAAAKKAKADIFITADLKYHNFFEADNEIVLVDIGHYETEQFTKNLIVDYLTKKIPNFAIALAEGKTNPINYF